MYRVLLVDDEQIINDSLYAYICSLEGMDIDLMRCYSAEEALPLVNSTFIDILLTDIRMKQMNGIELAAHVLKIWPQCRVIFLTGYAQFQYAYDAIQLRQARYLLKNEGFERIRALLDECIVELDQRRRALKNADEMRKSLEMVFPIAEQYWLTQAIDGHVRSFTYTGTIPARISAARPAYLAVVDPERDERTDAVIAAINAIFEQTLSPQIQFVLTIHSRLIVMFFQPGEGCDIEIECPEYVWQLLPQLQDAVYLQLGLNISICAAQAYVEFAGLNRCFRALCSTLYESMLECPGALVRQHAESNPSSVLSQVVNVEELRFLLQMEQESDFFQLLGAHLNSEQESGACNEICSYLNTLSALMSVLDTPDDTVLRLKAVKLANPLAFESWRQAIGSLTDLAHEVFDLQRRRKIERSSLTIDRIKRYIVAHYSDDLSLTSIADQFHFSPTYLSRIFHKETSIMLKDYIASYRIHVAKRLLADEAHKIRDIASITGFGSVKYFNTVFKKATGQTPSEWRRGLQLA